MFTLEELRYSPDGFLYTRGPGMYKIPGFKDIPVHFNVSILKGSSNPKAVYSSKVRNSQRFVDTKLSSDEGVLRHPMQGHVDACPSGPFHTEQLDSSIVKRFKKNVPSYSCIGQQCDRTNAERSARAQTLGVEKSFSNFSNSCSLSSFGLINICFTLDFLQAIGEPPLSLSSSVFFAIFDAVAAARKAEGLGSDFRFDSPATAERIRMACVDRFTKQVRPDFVFSRITLSSLIAVLGRTAEVERHYGIIECGHRDLRATPPPQLPTSRTAGSSR